MCSATAPLAVWALHFAFSYVAVAAMCTRAVAAAPPSLMPMLVGVTVIALLVLAVARWRTGWVLAPLGLLALAGLSALIEKTQLELARIDRACDVTDVVDNVTGALVGAAIGIVLVAVLQPWRHRHRKRSRTRG